MVGDYLMMQGKSSMIRKPMKKLVLEVRDTVSLWTRPGNTLFTTIEKTGF